MPHHPDHHQPLRSHAGGLHLSFHTPSASETPTYDLDGNLTADGRWTCAWDGENRLVSMTTTAAAVLAGVPDQRLTFAYDAQSRRIGKVVEHATGLGSWELDSDTRFVYDGWNLLAEVEMHNSAGGGRAKDAPAGVEGPYVRRSYLWGPDVSGTMQGAGGVGGLLAVRRHARGTQGPVGYWAVWDLNGNVIGLQENARSSARVANYDYDPFGKPLRVSEPEEVLNPFRFSTKYTDAETGLCYYGFRYYDAVRGRWLNRDPIEEEGGVNLYGMVGNDPVNRWDLLGRNPMELVDPHFGTGVPKPDGARDSVDQNLIRDAINLAANEAKHVRKLIENLRLLYSKNPYCRKTYRNLIFALSKVELVFSDVGKYQPSNYELIYKDLPGVNGETYAPDVQDPSGFKDWETLTKLKSGSDSAFAKKWPIWVGSLTPSVYTVAHELMHTTGYVPFDDDKNTYETIVQNAHPLTEGLRIRRYFALFLDQIQRDLGLRAFDLFIIEGCCGIKTALQP